MSCNKDNANYSTRITMLNAVPIGSTFTIVVNDEILSSNLQYGVPSFNVPSIAATTNVKWKRNTSTTFDSSFNTDLPNATDFTLLFFDSAKKYQAVLMPDYWQQATSKSQSYLRFLPMINSANNLRLTNDSGKTIISNRGFGDFINNTNYRGFEAADTTTKNKLKLYNGNVLIDSLQSVNLKPGKSYSIYAIGILNSTGVTKPKMIIHEHE